MAPKDLKAIEEYRHVLKIYPELEAAIRSIYNGHTMDKEPNHEVIQLGWKTLELIAGRMTL